jgi:2-epi-5-epi-valiolone synthase
LHRAFPLSPVTPLQRADRHTVLNSLYKTVLANRERSYRVSISPGLSAGDVSKLVQAIDGRKALLITTPSVARLFANRISTELIDSGVNLRTMVLACNEQSKTIAEVERICSECFRSGLDRRSLLIGCGGGVCTDLVTMAAALTRRGLAYLRIPTTLIGLIDAGIGIKGAVNLPNKKSAIGAFFAPNEVLLDPEFLRTLPKEFISGGLAEAIKIGVTVDRVLFEFLEQFSSEFLQSPSTADSGKLTELVWRSTIGLLGELEPNLYEDRSYRRVLDFGHTFSPTVESMSNFEVSHGTAVAIDIALSSVIAWELGLLSAEDRDRILELLQSSGLPIYSPLLTNKNCTEALKDIEAHRGGDLNLVLPSGIGKATFIEKRHGLSMPVIQRALDFLEQEAQDYPRPAPVESARIGPLGSQDC